MINSLGLATIGSSLIQPTTVFAQAEEPEPDEVIMSAAEKNAILKLQDALKQFEEDLNEGDQELIDISIDDSKEAYESAKRTVISEEGKAMLAPLIQRYEALKARAEQEKGAEEQPQEDPQEKPQDGSQVDPKDNSSEKPEEDPKIVPEEPKENPQEQPKEDPQVNPKDDSQDNPQVDPKDDSQDNPQVDPNENPQEQPQEEPKAEPKVEVKEEAVMSSIPYKSVREENPDLPKGMERIKTPGKEGVETITYQVTYTDGKVTSRTEVKREVTSPAVDEVIEVGTKEATATPVIEIKTETKTEAVAYTTVYEENPELPKGEKRVKTSGQNGVETITYSVIYVNGKETERTEVKREMTSPVVNEVIEVGTKEDAPTPPTDPTSPTPLAQTQVHPQVQPQTENKQLPATGESANTGLVSGLMVLGLALVSFIGIGKGKKYKK